VAPERSHEELFTQSALRKSAEDAEKSWVLLSWFAQRAPHMLSASSAFQAIPEVVASGVLTVGCYFEVLDFVAALFSRSIAFLACSASGP